jgi:glutathione S-transferase
MKLYYTPTSPFVRKVLIAAHELGLAERVETTLLRPSPLAPNAELSGANPLSKIPALILDDGTGLYDSRVICEYLETLRAPGVPALVPASGPERFRTLRLQALCDGVLEAGILVFYERAMRPPALHWEDWLAGQTQKVLQGLDALERECAHFGDDVDLAQVAAGATIGWLEFRNVCGDLRSSRPRLFAWYERFSARPSMRATVPVG